MAELEGLRSLCVWMARAAGALAIGFFVVAAALWLNPAWAAEAVRAHLNMNPADVTLSFAARALAGILSAAHAGLLCAALLAARRLFLRFAHDAAIEAQTGRDLRLIGGLVAAYALTTPLSKTLMVLAVTMDNPPGHRMLTISLGSNELILGVLGALILVLGHVMAEAARIADDNRQIV
jgi:hypothetical protein